MSVAPILLDLANISVSTQDDLVILEDCIKRIVAYDKLREERLKKLTVLESAGVDNWEGYDEAMRELHGDNEDELLD